MLVVSFEATPLLRPDSRNRSARRQGIQSLCVRDIHLRRLYTDRWNYLIL
jgi:hypothetical protein